MVAQFLELDASGAPTGTVLSEVRTANKNRTNDPEWGVVKLIKPMLNLTRTRLLLTVWSDDIGADDCLSQAEVDLKPIADRELPYRVVGTPLALVSAKVEKLQKKGVDSAKIEAAGSISFELFEPLTVAVAVVRCAELPAGNRALRIVDKLPDPYVVVEVLELDADGAETGKVISKLRTGVQPNTRAPEWDDASGVLESGAVLNLSRTRLLLSVWDKNPQWTCS